MTGKELINFIIDNDLANKQFEISDFDNNVSVAIDEIKPGGGMLFSQNNYVRLVLPDGYKIVEEES